jgi:hypothetical protein
VRIPAAPKEVPYFLLSIFFCLASIYSGSKGNARQFDFVEETFRYSVSGVGSEPALKELTLKIAATEAEKRIAAEAGDTLGMQRADLRLEEFRRTIALISESKSVPFFDQDFVLPKISVGFPCTQENAPLARQLIREWRLRLGDSYFPSNDDFAKRQEIKLSTSISDIIVKFKYITSTYPAEKYVDITRTLRSFGTEKIVRLSELLKRAGQVVADVYSVTSYPSYVIEILLDASKSIEVSFTQALAAVKSRYDVSQLSPFEKSFFMASARLDSEIFKKFVALSGSDTPQGMPATWKMAVIDSATKINADLWITSFLKGEQTPAELYIAPEVPVHKKTYADITKDFKLEDPAKKPAYLTGSAASSLLKYLPSIPAWIGNFGAMFPTVLEYLALNELVQLDSQDILTLSTGVTCTDNMRSFWKDVFNINYDIPNEQLPRYRALIKSHQLQKVAQRLREESILVGDQAALESWLLKLSPPSKEAKAPRPKAEKKEPEEDAPIDAPAKPVPASTILCGSKSYSRKDLLNRVKVARAAGKAQIEFEGYSFTPAYLERQVNNPSVTVLKSFRKAGEKPKN